MNTLTPELEWLRDIPLPEGWRWGEIMNEPAANKEGTDGIESSWITHKKDGTWTVKYSVKNYSYYPYGYSIPCTMEEACHLLAKAIWLDLAYNAD